jgi:hypothetical protein
MNLCNLICKHYDDKYDITAVCFDIKKKNMIIQDDKNTRWIKEGSDIPFSEWVKIDKKFYETYINIPFYGDINAGKCVIVKECGDTYFKRTFEHNGKLEKFVGVCITDEDFKNFHLEHSKFRWKKYMVKETGKFFSSYNEAYEWFCLNYNDKILSLENFISSYPCKYMMIENIKLE